MVTVCNTIFYTEKFYVLPTEYICMFNAFLRSDYFCIQSFRFLIADTECVYCAARNESLNIILVNLII
jgi:hypothetical protein